MKLKHYLLICLCLFSGIKAFAYDAYVNGIYYNFSGDEASVTNRGAYYYNFYSDTVSIPSSFTYNDKTYRVTAIDNSAFRDCSGLKSVTIPESVTSIGEYAFAYCSSLPSITIPESVTSIGNHAFSSCSSLLFIYVPNSVTSIGEYAFSNCRSLTFITIPKSLTSIGRYAFMHCSNLTSITIPKNVTSIEDGVFQECSGLTSVTIPNSVTSIGGYAFQFCSSLTSITIPNNVTSIGDYAFHGCSSFTSVTIPNSVTSIGQYAFIGCSSLSSITIPNSVTSIGDSAFLQCSGLTSVTIPNSVTSIGVNVFLGCSSLSSIIVESSNTVYDSRSNCNAIIETATNTLIARCKTTVIPNSVTSIGDYAFNNCSDLTSVTIPNSVTSIGENAFSFCSGLTSITIPESVTSIGNGAFAGCSGLTSITIPNSVTSIGGYAFYGCSSLTSITIPESVTSIGNGAFQICSGLTTVTIPNSVTSIGQYAFIGCSSLSSITIPNSVTSIGGYAFSGCSSLTSVTIPNSVTSIGIYAFQNCSGLTSVTIPESVTSIGDYTFAECSGLTSVTIPESVTSIGDYAFAECSGLTSVTIPNSVTSIGIYAFQNCSGLTSVTIPNSVTSIGFCAFSGCSGLTSVTIPNSVTNIGAGAFYGCYFLTKSFVNNSSLMSSDNWGATFYDEETNDGLIIKDNVVVKCRPWVTSATIPDGVTSIGQAAFSGCTALTSVTIPNSVTSIGQTAFWGCTALTSVTIPNSVTSIGYDVFQGCSGLTSVTIPNSVTSIGSSAFQGCSGLTSITIPNSVTSIDNYTFRDCSGLTSVTIPESVTSIGYGAFQNCSSLTSVTIPNSVTSIGQYAFNGCHPLIVCNREELPSASSSSFESGTFALVPPTAVERYQNAYGWNVLTYNGCSINKTTQTTVTLTTSSLLSVQYVIINNDESVHYHPDGDTLKITGLSPDMAYTIKSHYQYGGVIYESSFIVKTLPVNLFLYREGATNLTITVKGIYNAGDATVTESGFENMAQTDEYKQNGLKPGAQQSFTYYVICSDGRRFAKTEKLSTIPITASANVSSSTSSSCQLTGSCHGVIDATVTDYGFEGYPNQTTMKLTGLDPKTTYTRTYYVTTEEGGTISKDVSFMTDSLILTAQQPKVISEGNVIVAAETNVDDEEANVGFEWRRIDWTDDFDSKSGGAYLFEGMMEGYIRSVNSNYLWKFRPFYTSNAGNTYYGEWKGMDPSDYSYFEPTVHTYADIDVTGNSAEVKGYAMRGTDNVTSQGFMYWENNTSYSLRRRVASIPDNVTVVKASGNVMTAKFENLEYETSYSYVAFVTTSEGETFYGEVKTFSTGFDPVGIDEVKAQEAVTEIARYDVQGRRIDKPQKGMNIIHYSDGSTRKVMVK